MDRELASPKLHHLSNRCRLAFLQSCLDDGETACIYVDFYEAAATSAAFISRFRYDAAVLKLRRPLRLRQFSTLLRRVFHRHTTPMAMRRYTEPTRSPSESSSSRTNSWCVSRPMGYIQATGSEVE